MAKKCFGFTSIINLKRCKNKTNNIVPYCNDHSKQPIYFILILIVIPTIINLLSSSISPSHIPVVNTINEEIYSKKSDKLNIKNTDQLSNILSISDEKLVENNEYKEVLLKKRVVDINNHALKNVKIWCANCVNNQEVYTNIDGKFYLKIDFYLKEKSIQKLKICFEYNSNIKCEFVRYNSINELIPPKFIN